MATHPATLERQTASPISARRDSGDGGSALTIGDLLSMLRRRIVAVVGLFVLFTLMAVGGFMVWWVYFPGYESESLIECISNIPHAELTPEQVRLRQDEHDRFVLTQARLLKSPNILGEVLKLTAVRETHWWKTVQQRRWKKPEEHLIELIDELRATPMRGTNFLRVAMECRNPTDPKVIVQAVVSQWYDWARKGAADEFTSEPLNAAQEEQAALASEIEEGRNRLKAIALRLPPGGPLNPGGNITNEQVRQSAVQVANLRLELSQLEQYRKIYNDPEGLAVTAEDRAIVERDPQVAELTRRLFLLEQQRAADAKVFGGEHRLLQEVDALIESGEASLAQLRMEKLRERRADIREATNTAYDNTRHALFDAQEQLAKHEASLQDQDRLLFDYYTIEKDIEDKRKYKLELDNYIKDLKRIKAQKSAINVNIAQPATDPLERNSPTLLVLPIGVFLAIVLAVGIGLGLEILDTSVRTSQDVVRYLDTALLGLVPHTDDEEVAIDQVETAMRDAPRSMIAEAFRRIRTNLQFSAPAQRQRSVIVTSPRPNDGKTTVACNFAIAVAQSGRRVLLVDANLRRPEFDKVFQNIPAKGLSNILTGDGTVESCAVETDVPRLDVLGGGAVPPNPVELLGSEPFRAFLSEAISLYDQVIIDTAPVLVASDALVLASAVDGVIFVIRANRSSRGVARRACALLADVGAHLFGTVLNGAQVTRGGYFREQLRAYYDYHSDPQPAGSPAPPTPRRPEQPSPGE